MNKLVLKSKKAKKLTKLEEAYKLGLKEGIKRGGDEATTLILTLLYTSLVDEFKFDTFKLTKLSKKMTRYCSFINSGAIEFADLKISLIAQGIEVDKIGEK